MAATPNDILALLMGGMSPVDPRAQFMGQAFSAGRLPGDPTSNLNTILDLMSPSASSDMMDRLGGPPALEQTFGLDPNEVSRFIRQSLGMELSPGQLLSRDVGMMQALPDFLQAQASQTTAEAKAKEAETSRFAAEKTAGVAEREATVKESAEQRLRDTFERGTPQDQAALYEMNLKTIALTGQMLDGTRVDKAIQQNAFTLLRGVQATPGLSELISSLAKEGNWEAAGQLVGLPPGSIKSTWWGLGKGAAFKPGTQVPSPMNLFGTTGMSSEVMKEIEGASKAWQENFMKLIDKLQAERNQ